MNKQEVDFFADKEQSQQLDIKVAFMRCEALAKTINASCYAHEHMSLSEERLCCLKHFLLQPE